jgi:hypothetical protein
MRRQIDPESNNATRQNSDGALALSEAKGLILR